MRGAPGLRAFWGRPWRAWALEEDFRPLQLERGQSALICIDFFIGTVSEINSLP